jgi:hypothetical protein
MEMTSLPTTLREQTRALQEYPAADASLVVEGAPRPFSSLLTWLT